jgi:hypothetical protein
MSLATAPPPPPITPPTADPVAGHHAYKSPPDFSMVLGGPLYQLFLRLRMVRQPLDLLTRRVVVISLLAWLPLLVLSLIIGRAWGGAKVPFLMDIAAHARFLVSLPLLIIAEWVVHTRVRPLIGQFLERDLIAPQDLTRFDQIIESSQRLRNSVWAEVILLVAVFTGGQLLFRTQATVHTGTWYADNEPGGGMHFTAAGMCYVYWSLPLYQFILFRWYFRLLIWCRFLWKVSRLNLQLIPTHPDHAAGLGFLAGTAHALMPLLVAQSATVAGVFASRIFFTGAELAHFKIEILCLMLFLLAMALGPLIPFASVLAACQRRGNLEYGLLASRYVAAFDKKWLRGESNEQELLGSADVQSLADMGNSFEVIRSMNILPFTKATVVRLAVISALPLLPLVLTVIPFDELVDRLFRSLL